MKNEQKSVVGTVEIEDYIFFATHDIKEKGVKSKINFSSFFQEIHLDCITRRSEELGNSLRKQANILIPKFKESLLIEKRESYLGTLDEIGLKVMFSNTIPTINIGDINHHHIGNLVTLTGAISSFSEPRVEIEFSNHCEKCNNNLKSSKPMRKCYCCDSRLTEAWVKKMKSYQDLDFVEHIENSSLNRAINIFYETHEIPEYNILNPYNLMFVSIEIVGYILYNEKDKKFEIAVLNSRQIDEMVLNPKQKEEAKLFIESNQKDLHKILRQHICPHIFGADNQIYISEAIIIGCSGEKDKQLHSRNQQMLLINIGKYGRGKSAITKSFIPYLPNSAVINTMSASQAGLKSGVTRNEKGVFQLVLGTLPRCHNSFCILEELDKTEDQANDYLTVISEGKVRLDKIIQFEKEVHINFIVNGNPRNGDFEPNVAHLSQIDLPTPFLDRADCIIISESPFNEETRKDFVNLVFGKTLQESPYPDSLIKNVFVYLKKYTKNPIILDDGMELIESTWKRIQYRQGDEKEATFKFEIRALISLIKFVKAWGRLHNYQTMNDERTAEACDVIYQAMLTVLNTGRSLDDFVLESKRNEKRHFPKNNEERKEFVLKTVKRHKDGIEELILIKACIDVGINSAKANEIVRALRSTHELMEHNANGTTFYRIGVTDSIILEDIDEPNICEWILDALDSKTLTDLELIDSAPIKNKAKIFEAIEIMLKNGEIMKIAEGKLKKV